MGQKALPRAKNTCLSIRMVHDHFWKNVFLTHFWNQNGPFSRHFGIFHGPKHVTTGSKRAKKHLFEHPKWSTMTFRKTRF